MNSAGVVFDTDLGTADTDGGDRSVDLHGVGVSLGDLTGHKTEHTLDDGQVHGALLGRRIADHLVKDHLGEFPMENVDSSARSAPIAPAGPVSMLSPCKT